MTDSANNSSTIIFTTENEEDSSIISEQVFEEITVTGEINRPLVKVINNTSPESLTVQNNCPEDSTINYKNRIGGSEGIDISVSNNSYEINTINNDNIHTSLSIHKRNPPDSSPIEEIMGTPTNNKDHDLGPGYYKVYDDGGSFAPYSNNKDYETIFDAGDGHHHLVKIINFNFESTSSSVYDYQRFEISDNKVDWEEVSVPWFVEYSGAFGTTLYTNPDAPVMNGSFLPANMTLARGYLGLSPSEWLEPTLEFKKRYLRIRFHSDISVTGYGWNYEVWSTNYATREISLLDNSNVTGNLKVHGNISCINGNITVDDNTVLTSASSIITTLQNDVATNISALASFDTNILTFLGSPNSTNLANAITDETGSGSVVFATEPVLVSPALGTPQSGDLTNCTGTATNLTAGNANTINVSELPPPPPATRTAQDLLSELEYVSSDIFTATDGKLIAPTTTAKAYLRSLQGDFDISFLHGEQGNGHHEVGQINIVDNNTISQDQNPTAYARIRYYPQGADTTQDPNNPQDYIFFNDVDGNSGWKSKTGERIGIRRQGNSIEVYDGNYVYYTIAVEVPVLALYIYGTKDVRFVDFKVENNSLPFYVSLFDSKTGTSLEPKTDENISYNASTNTLSVSNVSGNAATATKLATEITIAGRPFDGSQNLSIAATDLSDITSAGSGVIITTTERDKLDSIATDANYYILPKASSDGLGGIKVGTNLSIDASTGVLSSTNTTYSVEDGGLTQHNFTTALKNKLGGIAESADATNETTVAAAGAVMTSGDVSISGVKTFTGGLVTTSLDVQPTEGFGKLSVRSHNYDDNVSIGHDANNAIISVENYGGTTTDAIKIYRPNGNVSIPNTINISGDLNCVDINSTNKVKCGNIECNTIQPPTAGLSNTSNIFTTSTGIINFGNPSNTYKINIQGDGIKMDTSSTIEADSITSTSVLVNGNAVLTSSSSTITNIQNNINNKLNLSGGTVTGNLTCSTHLKTDELKANTSTLIKTPDIKIESSYPRIFLTDTNNNPDFSIINANGVFTITKDHVEKFTIDSGDNVTINSGTPTLKFLDTNNNSDFSITVDTGHFKIKDTTTSTTLLSANSVGALNLGVASKITAIMGKLEVNGICTTNNLNISNHNGTTNGLLLNNVLVTKTASEINNLITTSGVTNFKTDALAKLNPTSNQNILDINANIDVKGGTTNTGAGDIICNNFKQGNSGNINFFANQSNSLLIGNSNNNNHIWLHGTTRIPYNLETNRIDSISNNQPINLFTNATGHTTDIHIGHGGRPNCNINCTTTATVICTASNHFSAPIMKTDTISHNATGTCDVFTDANGICNIGNSNHGVTLNGTVEIGSVTSSTASALNIGSSNGTKGLLLPKATTTQKNAITAPAGLMIYDTTENDVYVNNGTNFKRLSTIDKPSNTYFLQVNSVSTFATLSARRGIIRANTMFPTSVFTPLHDNSVNYPPTVTGKSYPVLTINTINQLDLLEISGSIFADISAYNNGPNYWCLQIWQTQIGGSGSLKQTFQIRGASGDNANEVESVYFTPVQYQIVTSGTNQTYHICYAVRPYNANSIQIGLEHTDNFINCNILRPVVM